jgi:hypothetical protein
MARSEKKMAEAAKAPERPTRSPKPKDYVPIEGKLVCKTCATEHEEYACKCGKAGTMEYMLEHLKERWAKNTNSALAAHMLVRPDPLEFGKRDMPSLTQEQAAVVERIHHRGIEEAPEPVAKAVEVPKVDDKGYAAAKATPNLPKGKGK